VGISLYDASFIRASMEERTGREGERERDKNYSLV
jgi:hypothetical protein